MKQFARYSLAALFLFAADHAQVANAQLAKAPDAAPVKRSTASVGGGDVERGKYLVESVVVCGRCHTPRNEAGNMDLAKRLEGAAILQPVPGWATYAPRLAGAPPGTDEDTIRILTSGIARTGYPPRQPMLILHMTRPDAEAVLAYLKSLRR